MFLKITANLFVVLTLISSALNLKIDKCWTGQLIQFSDEKLGGANMDGYIDADLDLSRINNVALVNNITFNGQVRFKDEPTADISVKFPSIKLVRIQRIIEYDRDGSVDVVRSQCNLGFVINYGIRMGVRYVIENQILQHAEYCIKQAICNFDQENHKIGDDFVVKSKSRKESWHFTSQTTVNAATDVLLNKLVNGLVAANMSELRIPKIETSFYVCSFTSSGGPIEGLLTSMQRTDDFTFLYEGHRYIFETKLNLTGGHIDLSDVLFSALLVLRVNGQLGVNMAGSELHMKVAFDYNTSPCKVSVEKIELTVPEDGVDFSKLNLYFVSIEKLLYTIGGKSTLINFLSRQVEKLLKGLIEKLKCEDYRALLFGNWTQAE